MTLKTHWLFLIAVAYSRTDQSVMSMLKQCDAGVMLVWCHKLCCRKKFRLNLLFKKRKRGFTKTTSFNKALSILSLGLSETRKTYYWLFWLRVRLETHQGVMPMLHKCDVDMLKVWWHWHWCRKGSDLKFSLKKEEKGVHKKYFFQQNNVYITKLFFITDTNDN